MTLLKLFNASNANSPKDDAGGSNAQPKSKGRDRSPSPPMDDVDFDSTDMGAATLRGFLRSEVSLACLGIIVLALLVVGGVGIFQYNSASAAGRIQQQETLFVADNRGGKAGKEPSLLCDSPVKCGDTIPGTGKKKLTLFQDLVCTEEPQPGEECAITVSGEDAELDCNDFMITPTQDTSGSWTYGICASNGAKAMNCPVQRFGAGIHIEDGGEIEDCETVKNLQPQQRYLTRFETSFEIEGVRSINNGFRGMTFTPADDATLNVRVKDSETSYNGSSGIYIDGEISSAYVDFELEGFFNSRYNDIGMNFGSPKLEGEMRVKGVVNIYGNKSDGFSLGYSEVDVVVQKKGAFNSCNNNQSGGSFLDIVNEGSGTFSGDGYTCGTGPLGANLPDCEDCPSCPSE
eukprot:scaffold10859_cov95-Skeletonema_dohrnii-CCMP3373.AAC.7